MTVIPSPRYTALTAAPWYPARPGDILHVHLEAAGALPDLGETYIVEPAAAAPPGMLQLRLLAAADSHGTDLSTYEGPFAGAPDSDPLAVAWMEAGPHRLTVVRHGRVVHQGGVR